MYGQPCHSLAPNQSRNSSATNRFTQACLGQRTVLNGERPHAMVTLPSGIRHPCGPARDFSIFLWSSAKRTWRFTQSQLSTVQAPAKFPACLPSHINFLSSRGQCALLCLMCSASAPYDPWHIPRRQTTPRHQTPSPLNNSSAALDTIAKPANNTLPN